MFLPTEGAFGDDSSEFDDDKMYWEHKRPQQASPSGLPYLLCAVLHAGSISSSFVHHTLSIFPLLSSFHIVSIPSCFLLSKQRSRRSFTVGIRCNATPS